MTTARRAVARPATCAGTVELPGEVFDVQVNVPLMHQVVVAQLAAARQGTHDTKTRGEVRGGGRKPYRQKGTGRARQGSTRAPQFAGGGVVHGPTPRCYAQRTPKKMKAAALRGALSDRARGGKLHVVSGLVEGDAPSTKTAVARARRRSRPASHVLVVVERTDALTWKSLRNVDTVHLLAPGPAQHLRRAGQRRRGLHRGRARGVPRPVRPQGRHRPDGRRGAGRTEKPPPRSSPRRRRDQEGAAKKAAGARTPRRRRRVRRAVGLPSRPPTATDELEPECHRADRRCRGGAGMIPDPRDILLAPVISEKSYGLLDENKYTFLVRPDANKTQIKIAVEQVFNVKVTSVNTLNRPGKRKRTRAGFGQRNAPSAPSSASPPATASTSSEARSPDRVHRREGLQLMGIRKYKPTTPGRRGSQRRRLRRDHPRRAGEVAGPPAAQQGRPQRRTAGSPSATRAAATSAPTGVIDFRRNDKDGVPAKVAHIEYDPNRTARIALLHYADGEKRYIIAPARLKQGDAVESGPSADIKPGNNLPLRNIPVGTVVHAIELRPGGGAKIARSAGASVQLVAKDGAVRPAAHALGRDPQRRRALPRHGRRGRQRRAVEHQLGQGRPHALEGQAPDRPRCRHEPDRPPARWW